MTTRQPIENTKGGWLPSSWFLAQSAHLGWSAALVAFSAAMGWSPWWAVAGITVAAGIKEFIGDIWVFEHDTLRGSAVDFAFYLAGALVCRIALWHPIAGVFLLALLMVGLTIWDYESQQPQGWMGGN